MNNVIVYVVLKIVDNERMQCYINCTCTLTEDGNYHKFHSPTGPYAWLVFSSISSLGDTSS